MKMKKRKINQVKGRCRQCPKASKLRRQRLCNLFKDVTCRTDCPRFSATLKVSTCGRRARRNGGGLTKKLHDEEQLRRFAAAHPAVRPEAKRAMLTAFTWWGIISCMKLTSTPSPECRYPPEFYRKKLEWLETTRSMSDKIELERVYAALFGCWRVQRYVGEPLHDALWGKDRMFWR